MEAKDRNGGLALLWRQEINISIQNYSNRHINDTVKEEKKDKQWQIIGFYGHL